MSKNMYSEMHRMKNLFEFLKIKKSWGKLIYGMLEIGVTVATTVKHMKNKLFF
jgi:fumarate reductase subunit D